MKVNVNYENKRNLILEAFYKLVAELGMENVSITKIAKAINIPSSLIFYYFKNKQELIYGLIDYMFDRCIDVSIPPVEMSNKDVKGEFTKFIDSMFSVKGALDIDSRVYFSCVNIALRDKKAKEKFIAYTQQANEKLLRYIEYFKDKGVINCDNATEIVYYLMVVIAGLQDTLDFLDDHEKFKCIVDFHKKQLFRFLAFIE
ncbi:TetR/AcrR family transcriptional regulator [Aminipila sp.]|uniref:TetR/AcrR family transcriptional regulator n=1 Tax=Aminipila sp. TaxID=2060095 RepID=UPI00289B6636|nr:TetR/AcrR family transcriptional regulator [Aminipila sp.]